MPAKTKKAVAKKGKYFLNFSSATHPLKTKLVGPARLDTCLQPHGFGILG